MEIIVQGKGTEFFTPNEVILNISHLPTSNIGGGFSDFPNYDISISEIKVIEE